MNRYSKMIILSLGIVALTLSSVGFAAAQQGGQWVRERVYDGLEENTATFLRNEINSGARGGELKNATVVQDARTGRFAVEAERYNAAPPTVVTAKTLSGSLAAPAADKRGIARHTVQLTPGARYTVELQSGSGGTHESKALPGFFDPTLLVEDGQGASLGMNDDIDWPRNCNSRVTITVPSSGTVRIVVSSYRAGEAGPYTVQITPQ